MKHVLKKMFTKTFYFETLESLEHNKNDLKCNVNQFKKISYKMLKNRESRKLAIYSEPS